MKRLVIVLTFLLTNSILVAQIKVDSQGKVAIGGSTPSSNYALSISGGLNVSGSINGTYTGSPYLNSFNTRSIVIFSSSSLSNYSTISYVSTGLNVSGSLSSSSSLSGSSISSASIGIITTAPGGSTSFYGNSLRLYGQMGSFATLTCNYGSLQTNGATVVTSSDERLKKDIRDIESAATILNALKGQRYYYKSKEELERMDFGGAYQVRFDTMVINGEKKVIQRAKNDLLFNDKMHFGFMAQEVQEILPELVYYDSISGTYGLDYLGFIPILVEANKELQAKIKVLEADIEKLTNKYMGKSSERLAEEMSPNLTIGNELFQNTPNPFHQKAEIKFSLNEQVKNAMLCIYDLQGRQIKSYQIDERGNSSLSVQAGDFQAGMYLYSLIADGEEIGTKKLILTK